MYDIQSLVAGAVASRGTGRRASVVDRRGRLYRLFGFRKAMARAPFRFSPDALGMTREVSSLFCIRNKIDTVGRYSKFPC